MVEGGGISPVSLMPGTPRRKSRDAVKEGGQGALIQRVGGRRQVLGGALKIVLVAVLEGAQAGDAASEDEGVDVMCACWVGGASARVCMSPTRPCPVLRCGTDPCLRRC